MTVRQIGRQTFNAPKAIVAEHVRRVLNRNPAYWNVKESDDGSVITTHFKRNIPLVLGTDMRIVLEEANSETVVTVTTTSQPFIIGDAFGFYLRYVRYFLAALRKEISAHQDAPVVSGEATYKMETSWASIALIVVLAALLLFFSFGLEISSVRLFFVIPLSLLLLASLVRMVRGGRLRF